MKLIVTFAAEDSFSFRDDTICLRVSNLNRLKDVINNSDLRQDFIDENNQNGKIKVIALADNGTPPVKNDNITAAVYGNENYKAGDHQFYAVVYKKETTVGEDDNATTTTNYCVRFCCSQKGNGKNQFPFADYTYGEVLAD